ncbi:MAG: hypothetical protein OEY22_11870, partial [Candidatus Bathyarchaeota archaeon]|nr:hypothetical protein [Candidatus Bathyarchaeota archaeon]
AVSEENTLAINARLEITLYGKNGGVAGDISSVGRCESSAQSSGFLLILFCQAFFFQDREI